VSKVIHIIGRPDIKGQVVERLRRKEIDEINGQLREREQLTKDNGQVWNTKELARDFDVLQFLAPFIQVRRKEDRKVGIMSFQHMPRYYWGFEEDGN